MIDDQFLRPVLISIFLSAALSSCGYATLNRELNEYKPAPLYDTLSEEREHAASGPVAAHRKTPKHETIRQQLLEAADKKEGEYAFYRPDEDRLENYRPIAADVEKTAAQLADGFTIDDLEMLGLLRNPEIQAAEDRYRGSRQQYSQVVWLDDILWQYTAFTEALMTGIGPMKGTPPGSDFPFPGLVALKGDVVTQAVYIDYQNLEIARRRILTEIKKAFWNLYYNREARKITKEMQMLLDRLETVATTRYEAGMTSFQDIIQIRIKNETIRENLNTLKEQQDNLETEIIKLADLPPGRKIGRPKHPGPAQEPPSINILYEQALEHNQELAKARARVVKMEKMIEMAETMILPPFTFNLSRFEDRAVMQAGSAARRETFPVSTKATAGELLPKMPWYGRNDAYLGQTRQELAAAREELDNMKAAIRLRVRRSWFELDRARRERNLYADTIIGLSRAALDVATRGYESGRVGFADVIMVYTNWLDSNLSLERKKADYSIAGADLSAAVGRKLELRK